MKRALILVSFLAFQSVQSFRQHVPPHQPPRHDSFSSSSSSSESVSSISSEEDSFERIGNQKKQIQPEKFLQLQKQQQQPRSERIQAPEEKKNKFFDRPSSDELDAYDEKVQRQSRNRGRPTEFVQEEHVQIPMNQEGPLKKENMDETDEKMFLATLGQIYLQKMDEEEREADRFPGPILPMGPPGPPMDADYFFVPYEEEGKKQANNNGNNNVHVNVNHVQVNSNVLHVPAKEDKKQSDHHRDHEMPPIVPSYHMNEPVTQSKYLYLNLNATDACIMVVLVAVFLFATKKAYSRCFPKKSEVAPQLPTTLPPTYTPSNIVVETTSKKMAPQ